MTVVLYLSLLIAGHGKGPLKVPGPLVAIRTLRSLASQFPPFRFLATREHASQYACKHEAKDSADTSEI